MPKNVCWKIRLNLLNPHKLCFCPRFISFEIKTLTLKNKWLEQIANLMAKIYWTHPTECASPLWAPRCLRAQTTSWVSAARCCDVLRFWHRRLPTTPIDSAPASVCPAASRLGRIHLSMGNTKKPLFCVTSNNVNKSLGFFLFQTYFIIDIKINCKCKVRI